MIVARLSLAGICALSAVGCHKPAPVASIPYNQDFSGARLGPEWSSRSGGWQLLDGRLFNDGAHNVPLWLSAALPANVRVTFTAESRSPAVDLKFEIFGNGRDHQSGYVVILAGWNNSKSIIARLDEHGPQRSPQRDTALRAEYREDPRGTRARYRKHKETIARSHRGEANHVYRFRCERREEVMRFFVDDALHLEYFDPSPLGGPDHDRFAFNNWASRVFFDDLKIERLE